MTFTIIAKCYMQEYRKPRPLETVFPLIPSPFEEKVRVRGLVSNRILKDVAEFWEKNVF